jgi:hypothetical protein
MWDKENYPNTIYQIDPAKLEEIDWIANLEAEVYSSNDAPPKSVLEEWYCSNLNGFSIIRNKEGQKIGHIDILPLRPEALRKLVDGVIVERDIRGNDLYTPAERNLIRSLYIESVVIHPAQGSSNARAVLYLLCSFISLVERLCNPADVENLYAIAATTRGIRFIRHVGFNRIKEANERKDGHDFFATTLADLAARLSRLCGITTPSTLDASSVVL